MIFLKLLFLIAFLSTISAQKIVDFIKTEPELSEAHSWGKKTGLLDSMDVSQYGEKVSLIIPSNAAFRKFSEQYPERKDHLLSNEEDLQTLMLFAATDHAILPESIKEGKFSSPQQPLVSLLSQSATISSDGQICIIEESRANHPCSDEEPCCAQIDLDKVFEAEDGFIYIIDQIIQPAELLETFSDLGI